MTHRQFRSGLLMLGSMVLLLGFGGCRVLDRKATAAVSTPALSWLTAFHPSSEPQTPFDLTVLKPAPSPVTLQSGDLLEITVWDLYEPGKPHGFPVRVADDRTVEVPLLGAIHVPDSAAAEFEARLAQEFRDRDLLKQPRVVVRSLDSPTIEIRVEGAVLAPGPVQLPRESARVFHALANCGGLKGSAGRQIGITSASAQMASTVRGQSPKTSPVATPNTADSQPAEADLSPSAALPMEPGSNTAATESAPATSGESTVTSSGAVETSTNTEAATNTGETVPQSPDVISKNGVAGETPASSANRPARSTVRQTHWYDLTQETDVVVLRNLVLETGDVISVSSASPPVRIAGAVSNPGSFRLPAANDLDVWDTVLLAGGIQSKSWPVIITLYRPPAEGTLPQRWSWTVARPEAERPTTNLVLPGDMIHVGPAAGTRIKHAVGGLWKR